MNHSAGQAIDELLQISSTVELEDVLSRPYPEDVQAVADAEGDFLVLGAGGKMGPTLVKRLCRALSQAGKDQRVFAVSRFGGKHGMRELEREGALPIQFDLLKADSLDSLPDCPNVLFLVGAKFGTTGQEPFTWATNTYLPARVAQRWRDSKIIAWSTGNVYPLVPVQEGGSRESDTPQPVGEYAQSCLGRERILQFFSEKNGTPVCLLRLNYAVEARYGVLLDTAARVLREEPVPVTMGYFNAIWQGDANSICIRSLALCDSPPCILNVTGPELLSVRRTAEQFAELLDVPVCFSGTEEETALLSNAGRCQNLFGAPRVSIQQVVRLVAHWLKIGGHVLGKPTRFETRDGRF